MRGSGKGGISSRRRCGGMPGQRMLDVLPQAMRDDLGHRPAILGQPRLESLPLLGVEPERQQHPPGPGLLFAHPAAAATLPLMCRAPLTPASLALPTGTAPPEGTAPPTGTAPPEGTVPATTVPSVAPAP